MNTTDLIAHGPVIPVIVLQRTADAVPMAEALLAGGVRVLEITLRTPAALAGMEAIARALPEAIVGAGAGAGFAGSAAGAGVLAGSCLEAQALATRPPASMIVSRGALIDRGP